MRFFTARRLALAGLFPALLSFVVIPGCAQQGEGERCGDSSGVSQNDDCGDGLSCLPAETFLGGTQGSGRCCYPDRKATDSRCTPKGTSSTAGAGGGSSAGSGGGDAAGADSSASEAGAGEN